MQCSALFFSPIDVKEYVGVVYVCVVACSVVFCVRWCFFRPLSAPLGLWSCAGVRVFVGSTHRVCDIYGLRRLLF